MPNWSPLPPVEQAPTQVPMSVACRPCRVGDHPPFRSPSVQPPPADRQGTGAQADDHLLRSFVLAQKACPVLNANAEREGALFATVSRLDGAFGLRSIDPDRRVESGGLAGLSKTAGWEWPKVACRAFDLDA